MHVLTQAKCPTGFLLLRLLRSYLELDMYASLTVHTDVTIALGRDELLRFGEILQVNIELILTPLNLHLFWFF